MHSAPAAIQPVCWGGVVEGGGIAWKKVIIMQRKCQRGEVALKMVVEYLSGPAALHASCFKLLNAG